MKRKLVLSILMVLACGMLAGCDSKKTSPDNGESISTLQESSANDTSADNGLSSDVSGNQVFQAPTGGEKELLAYYKEFLKKYDYTNKEVKMRFEYPEEGFKMDVDTSNDGKNTVVNISFIGTGANAGTNTSGCTYFMEDGYAYLKDTNGDKISLRAKMTKDELREYFPITIAEDLRPDEDDVQRLKYDYQETINGELYDVLLLMEDAKGEVAGLYGFRYYVNHEKQKLDKVDIIGPDQSFGCELGNSQPIVLPKDASKAKEVKAQDLINSMLKGMDVEM